MSLSQSPGVVVHKYNRRAVKAFKKLESTYVSKSISYNVSENGSGTGFHILEEAASAGFAATPTIPVAEANAVAATVDPVFVGKVRNCFRSN